MTDGPFGLSCPGNILLCGEYAILSEGGRGIGLAAGERAWLGAMPSLPAPGTGPEIRLWPAMEPGALPVPSPRDNPLLRALRDRHPALHDGNRDWDIILDTTGFHTPGGRKLGLGSSAAAVLLLDSCFHLLGHGSLEGYDPAGAVEVHRTLQGGRGSGYDIWTSFLGGLVDFTGGRKPRARRISALEAMVPSFRLLLGAEKSQSTPSAIQAWQAYRERHPDRTLAWENSCRIRADAACRAGSWEELQALLEEARTDGIRLGRELGVPADLPEISPPTEGDTGIPEAFRKATGAGNENCIVFGHGPTEVAPGSILPAGQPGLTLHRAVCARGRGKLILFGEHAALHGYPACGLAAGGCAVAMALECPSAAPGLDLSFLDAPLGQRISSALPLADLADRGSWRVLMGSSVPRSGGYGSSAAISVALAGLLAGLLPPPMGTDIWDMANRLDSLFHGKASGMDAGLALDDGLQILLPRDMTGLPAHAPLFTRQGVPPRGLWLVHSALPRRGNTRDLVARIGRTLKEGDDSAGNARRAMETLGETCKQAVEILETQKWQDSPAELAMRLGQLADRAQKSLEALGLSVPGIHSFLMEARNLGSTGGKMSGAGAGGAFWCIAETAETARRIARSWEDRSAELCAPVGITPF